MLGFATSFGMETAVAKSPEGAKVFFDKSQVAGEEIVEDFNNAKREFGEKFNDFKDNFSPPKIEPFEDQEE